MLGKSLWARGGICAGVLLGAAASMAAAQTAEIFIPGKTPGVAVQPEAPQNALANCLANPSAETCTGLAADPSGVTFEAATGQPTITFETLVLDLDDGYVHTKPEPPKERVDYDAPVTPPNYAPPPKHGDTYAPPKGDYAANGGYGDKIELPSVAVTIEFDFDSSYVRSDQIGKLQTLTAAFQDPALAGYAFAVIGHTDASGSDRYNCDLSRRRAGEVTNALRANYVTLGLFPVGFGERVLKNAVYPRAPENRRVTFLRLPSDARAVLDTSYSVCGGY